MSCHPGKEYSMKHFIKIIFIVLFTLVSPLTTYAWYHLPHMVITSIAYQNLTPTARQNFDKLVVVLENEYPSVVTSYLDFGPWADTIRSDGVGHYSRWHFIDNAWSGDGTPTHNVITTDNSVWAITACQAPIKNTQLYPIDRARFLALLTHIVGDSHQPEHSSTRFAKNFPNGDIGGTQYIIAFNGGTDGIHYLWDGGVNFFNSADTHANAIIVANQLMAAYPPSYFGDKVNDLDPYDWAQEGLAIAESFVYTVAENATPTPAYFTEGSSISQQRVTLAGYRLAAILNQLLANG